MPKKKTSSTSKVAEKKTKASASGAKAKEAAKKVKPKKTEKKTPKESESPTTGGKQEIIEKFQLKKGDTGSPEVQIALLSNRIEKLVSHLKENPSDNHSRRGLLGIVSKRRRLLNYLEKKEAKRYRSIAKKVGLSK